MELLRLGLISNSPLGMPTTPLPTGSQNQMTAATLEELYRQQCMAATPSPRLQQQQQQQQLHSFQQNHGQQQVQKGEHQQMQQLLQQHQANAQVQQVQKPQQMVAPIIPSNPPAQQQQQTPQMHIVSSQAQNFTMQQQISQQSQHLVQQQVEQGQKVQRQNVRIKLKYET